jgi:hypothetical protein
MFGKDTFWVKLQPTEVKLPVADGHNLLVCATADHLQFSGEMCFIYYPRMVTAYGKLDG